MTKFTHRQEKEKLLQSLFGFDTPVFGTIRSSILGEDPLSNVNQDYSKIFQGEQCKEWPKSRNKEKPWLLW